MPIVGKCAAIGMPAVDGPHQILRDLRAAMCLHSLPDQRLIPSTSDPTWLIRRQYQAGILRDQPPQFVEGDAVSFMIIDRGDKLALGTD